VIGLYRTVGTLAAEAVTDFNFDSVPGALAAFRPKTERPATTNAPARVLEGIDVLVKENFTPLKGLRVGLITNPTGQDSQRRSTIDLLSNAPGVELKMLFGPEHGLYGNFDAPVQDGVDSHTGLPVVSLYGDRHAPTAEQLKQLDALVFDIQDVGCRFYTFTTTLGLCMEAANAAGVKFFVLDRVDPDQRPDAGRPGAQRPIQLCRLLPRTGPLWDDRRRTGHDVQGRAALGQTRLDCHQAARLGAR
jgi:hypothetical protein